ncbi:hypothetical protein [Cellulosimicrobium sp. Marseille-Q8652]
MPTSPDGILDASYDAVQNLVRLTVDGGMWPAPVSRLTITRSSAGAPTEPLRTVRNRAVAGGWFLGYDDAAPMDATSTYTATGMDAFGGTVAVATVAVDVAGAEWGLWLKAPGRPQLTCRVALHDPGEVNAVTQGMAYQVPGGSAIAQWSGVDADSRTITVIAKSAQDAARVRALLAAERTLLIQTGQPEEIPSGYWFVLAENAARLGVRKPGTGQVWFTLPLTRTTAPVGEGQGFTGATYETARQRHPTYRALRDANATYFDVQQGD